MKTMPTEGSKNVNPTLDPFWEADPKFDDYSRQMKTLANDHCKNGTALGSPEQTTASVKDVVLRYRLRFANPDWTRGMPELIKASKKAEPTLLALLKAVGDLHPIGHDEIENHLLLQQELALILKGLPIPESIHRGPKTGKQNILKLIAQLYFRTLLYGLVVPPLYAGAKQSQTKSGRKDWATTAKYVEPTIDLIRMWHSLTGVPAVSPKQEKGIKGDQASQPSTEFVRLGLVMIDEELQLAQSRQKTITAIRSALKIEKEARAIAQEKLRALSLIDADLRERQY